MIGKKPRSIIVKTHQSSTEWNNIMRNFLATGPLTHSSRVIMCSRRSCETVAFHTF